MRVPHTDHCDAGAGPLGHPKIFINLVRVPKVDIPKYQLTVMHRINPVLSLAGMFPFLLDSRSASNLEPTCHCIIDIGRP